MRFIIANEFYQQMLQTPSHTPDCYVRPGEYLHHMYIDGVKYVIAQAVLDCLVEVVSASLAHLALESHPGPRDPGEAKGKRVARVVLDVKNDKAVVQQCGCTANGSFGVFHGGPRWPWGV